MERTRPLVEWSPHDSSHFVLASSVDLKLFDSAALNVNGDAEASSVLLASSSIGPSISSSSAVPRHAHNSSSGNSSTSAFHLSSKPSGNGEYSISSSANHAVNNVTTSASQSGVYSSGMRTQFAPGMNSSSTGMAQLHLGPAANLEHSRSNASHWKRKNNLIAVRSMSRPIRCVSWYPGADDPLLVATGDSTGHVRLVSFQENRNLESNGVVMEFGNNRNLNALSWNPQHTNIIAVGMDFTRLVNSIAFWDINRIAKTNGGNNSNRNSQQNVEQQPPEQQQQQQQKGTGSSDGQKSGTEENPNPNLPHPIMETGQMEGALALAWAPNNPNCLAVGTQFKWMRLYDIRLGMTEEPNTAHRKTPQSVVAHAKAVKGVVFDPCRPHCLATFSDDGLMKAWDTRRLDNPVITIYSQSKNTSQISWSPVQPGLLASVNIDEKCISLYDVRRAYDVEHTVKTRYTDAEMDSPPRNGLGDNREVDSGGATPRGDVNGRAVVKEGSSDDSGNIARELSNSSMPAQTTIELRKPDLRRYTKHAPASFCWIPGAKNQNFRPEDLVPGAQAKAGQTCTDESTNRVLFVSWSGNYVEDVSLQDPLPLSVSPTSSVSFGSSQGIRNLSFAAYDPSMVLRKRAKLGYSIDANANVALLDQTVAAAKHLLHGQSRSAVASEEHFEMVDRFDTRGCLENLLRLRDMWRWILRASSLIDPMRSRGLVDSGLLFVITQRPGIQGDTHIDATLKPPFCLYRSSQRTFALHLCGWRDFGDADTENSNSKSAALEANEDGSPLNPLDSDRDYQRAAALAVFDCNLPLAVHILQTEASLLLKEKSERLRFLPRTDGTEQDENLIADLLQLVAMALAGYPSTESQTSKLWIDSCCALTKRLGRFPILCAALKFLMENFERRILRSSNAEATSDGKKTMSSGSDTTSTSVDNEASSSIDSMSSEIIDFRSSSGPALAGIPENDPVGETAPNKTLNAGSRASAAGAGGDDYDPSKRSSNETDSKVPHEAKEKVAELEFSCVLGELAIPLTDRIAFACRFLPDASLYPFLEDSCSNAIENGHLDGIILTGLGFLGMRLLEAYVNRSGDVQSAALAVCHTIASELGSISLLSVQRWITSYRDLLNVWRLWQERARFDVRYAARERKLKLHREKEVAPASPASPPAPSGSNPHTYSFDSIEGRISERVKHPQPTTIAEDSAYTPASMVRPRAIQESQLYAVCTNCKESLLLSNILGDLPSLGGSSRVNDRKLTIPCCPRCKKRLSSCAVCVLPMSCINPYAQMAGSSARDRTRVSRVMEKVARQSQRAGQRRPLKGADPKMTRLLQAGGVDTESSQGSVTDAPHCVTAGDQQFLAAGTSQPFGRWFSWCLRCRHGGHAACMTEWFKSHVRCPVADCDCPCTSLR